MKFKRIFVIVMDSLGIGEAKDQALFHQTGEVSDLGANTFKHISEAFDKLNIPTLTKLGIKDLDNLKNIDSVEHLSSYTLKLNEASNGKDTIFVHCLSGARSRQAAAVLQQMGYTNVKNIGGISAYTGKVER